MPLGFLVFRKHFRYAAVRLLWICFVLLPSTMWATIDPVSSTDCFSCNGSASVSTNFTGEVTYEWYNGLGVLLGLDQNTLGNSSLFNLCPGVYQVQYTNGTDSAIEWFSIAVPGADAGQPDAVSYCAETGNYDLFAALLGTPQAGGDWSDPLGQPHSGTFDSAADVPGFYQYVINAGACTVTSGIDVTLIQNANAGLSATYLICETYNEFFLTDVLAGAPDLGGTWFDSNQNAFDGFYDPDVDVTGLFTYMIDTVLGCPPVFSTLFVIENALPDPGIDTELAVCPNATPFDMTVQLNGTPDPGGVWYDENNDPVGPLYDPAVLDEGVYNYVVQGLTPCPIQESFLTVTYTQGIDAGEDGNLAVCVNNGAADLFNSIGGIPTATGNWTDPSNAPSDGMVDPETALEGTYTYTVNAVGCQPQSSTVTFTVEQLPIAGTGQTMSFCENGSPVDLDGLLSADAQATGEWMIGGQPVNGSLVVEGGQTYQPIYTVASVLCPDDAASFEIVVDELPNAGPDNDLFTCSNALAIDIAVLMSPDQSFTSEWIDPMGNPTNNVVDPAVDLPGQYTLISHSENSCPDDQATLNVIISDPAFENGFDTFEDCTIGQQYDLNDVLPENIPDNGAWSQDGQNVPQLVDGNELSSGVYLYTINNPQGCLPSVFTFDLILVEPLNAGEGVDIVICSTSPEFTLDDQLQNDVDLGYWEYNGEGLGSTIIDPSNSTDGVYTYVVPGIGPCPADSAQIVLDIQEGLAFTAGPDLIVCEGDDNVFLGAGTCDNCEFDWTNGGLLNDASAESPLFLVPEVQSTETYQFFVSVDNGVCEVQDELIVTVHPTPELILVGDEILCAGDEGTWTVAGANTYEWVSLNNQVQSTDDNYTGLLYLDESISVTGTSLDGCATEVVLNVMVNPLPEPIFDLDDQNACGQVVVQLYLPESDGNNYWYEVDGVIYDEEVNSLVIVNEGGYDVTLFAESPEGCLNSFTNDNVITVYGYPESSWYFVNDQLGILSTEVEFVNTSIDATQFEWQFDALGTSTEESPILSLPAIADQSYDICLVAENQYGCPDTLCREIYLGGELIVYVPNAFTPDNDGINEVFLPSVLGHDPSEFEFSVFNRWGELIFRSEDEQQGWNGSFNNGQYYVQDGVYTWVLSVKDAYTAELKKFSGHVTIMR